MRSTELERFQKFYKTGPANACWYWRGFIDKRDGYGKFWFRSRALTAHRVAYILFRGDPGKLHVCHTCDNRPCVNPDHLWLGTHLDNTADRHRKGRSATGQIHPHKGTRGVMKPNATSFKKGVPKLNIRKLAESDIPVILDLLGQKVPVKEIARQFGVSFQLIYAVKYGKTYCKV